MSDDPHDLQRFVAAQEGVWERALTEPTVDVSGLANAKLDRPGGWG